MVNISPPLLAADKIIGSFQKHLPGGARHTKVRWLLRVVVIGMSLVLVQYVTPTLSAKLGTLVHSAITHLPQNPQVRSWVAVAGFFLIAVGLAQYKEYDSSSYGLSETVCGVVTVFSFLPDMFQQEEVTIETVVGLIGGLYFISEGFSLILESAKNHMASKPAQTGQLGNAAR